MDSPDFEVDIFRAPPRIYVTKCHTAVMPDSVLNADPLAVPSKESVCDRQTPGISVLGTDVRL